MNRVFVGLILILIVVAGLAYYAGWWNVTSDGAGQKPHIGVTVDRDKIQADEKKILDRMHDIGPPAKDKAANPAAASKE